MNRTQLYTSADLTRAEVDHLIEQAENLRNKRTKDLEGKIVATLFFEPSTRTRLSFESAILRLGGQFIHVTDAKTSSVKKGESLEDTIRMAELYADALVMRHPQAGAAERACNVTQKPFLNAGDGANQHPTQSLLDAYTIHREVGSIDGKTIAFVGDLKYSRTVHSLLYILRLYNPKKIIFISHKNLALPEKYKQMLSQTSISFEETDDLARTMPELDVLYTTRIQEERFENPEEAKKMKGIYVVTPKVVKMGPEHLRIMEPLPRIDQISPEVDALPQAAYFRQAENGVWMRMALLKYVMKNAQ